MGRDRARARLGKGKIIGLDATVRTGAIMVRKDSHIHTLAELRNVPIAVTWHAGTFYAAIEAMEAAGVPFAEVKLEHAADRLDALLSGRNEAAALMEPLVSRALEAGCRKIADLRWRGGIVAGRTLTKKPRGNCGARSTARLNGYARTRTARGRSSCAT